MFTLWHMLANDFFLMTNHLQSQNKAVVMVTAATRYCTSYTTH